MASTPSGSSTPTTSRGVSSGTTDRVESYDDIPCGKARPARAPDGIGTTTPPPAPGPASPVLPVPVPSGPAATRHWPAHRTPRSSRRRCLAMDGDSLPGSPSLGFTTTRSPAPQDRRRGLSTFRRLPRPSRRALLVTSAVALVVILASVLLVVHPIRFGPLPPSAAQQPTPTTNPQLHVPSNFLNGSRASTSTTAATHPAPSAAATGDLVGDGDLCGLLPEPDRSRVSEHDPALRGRGDDAVVGYGAGVERWRQHLGTAERARWRHAQRRRLLVADHLHGGWRYQRGEHDQRRYDMVRESSGFRHAHRRVPALRPPNALRPDPTRLLSRVATPAAPTPPRTPASPGPPRRPTASCRRASPARPCRAACWWGPMATGYVHGEIVGTADAGSTWRSRYVLSQGRYAVQRRHAPVPAGLCRGGQLAPAVDRTDGGRRAHLGGAGSGRPGHPTGLPGRGLQLGAGLPGRRDRSARGHRQRGRQLVRRLGAVDRDQDHGDHLPLGDGMCRCGDRGLRRPLYPPALLLRLQRRTVGTTNNPTRPASPIRVASNPRESAPEDP